MNGGTINPNYYSTLYGNLALNRDLMNGILLQSVVNAFSGKQLELDENAMDGKISIIAKLLRLIPITYSKEYSGHFTAYNNGEYLC